MYIYISSLNVEKIESMIKNVYDQYSQVTFIVDINGEDSFTMSDLWEIRPLIDKFKIYLNQQSKIIIVTKNRLHRSMLNTFLCFIEPHLYCRIQVCEEFTG